MIRHCWKYVNNAGVVEDCPGGDVAAAGKSIHELFEIGWESVREDLTGGGTLVCLRFRESAPVPDRWIRPDFSNWKAHDAFEAAFGRLLQDLKAEGPPAAK
jgi:hypothetical protein